MENKLPIMLYRGESLEEVLETFHKLFMAGLSSAAFLFNSKMELENFRDKNSGYIDDNVPSFMRHNKFYESVENHLRKLGYSGGFTIELSVKQDQETQETYNLFVLGLGENGSESSNFISFNPN